MRRLFSLTLLLLFFLPMLAPLAALGQGPEARVALCCRRGGEHHCLSAPVTDGTTQWRAPMRCPFGARAEAPGHTVRVGILASAANLAEEVAHPGVRGQTVARARIAVDRARPKRGPPADVLS